jgi:WD40 repeat protein
MQFISMFSGAIMSSMPHTYLSGLTFAPVSSLVYQRWQGQFPGVAKLAQGRLLHWPKIMLMLEGHHDIVQSLSFSPDGNCIASGSGDRTIQLWNAETGASIGQPMEGHDHDITSIAFSPVSKHIASGSYDWTI